MCHCNLRKCTIVRCSTTYLYPTCLGGCGFFPQSRIVPEEKNFILYTLLVFFDIHYFHHFCFLIVFRTLDEILNNAVNINLIYANRLCLCNRNLIADGYHCAVLCTFRCPGHLAHGRGGTGSLWIPLYSCIPDSIRTHGGMYMTNLHKVSSLHLSKSSSTGQNIFFMLPQGLISY